jgi:hypothetical protein
MSGVEDLRGLCKKLKRARLPGSKFIQRVRKQGGRLTPQAKRVAEGGIKTRQEKAQFYYAAMKDTRQDQHMTNPRAERCLRQSPKRFEAHCDLSEYK